MHLPRHPRRRSAVWATAVLDAVRGGDASFVVVLKDQADLTAARGKKSHAAKAKPPSVEVRTGSPRSPSR